MKVGIITYHRSQNYGAQLQAYATRRALCLMNHDAEILDCNTIGDDPIYEWHFKSFKSFIGSLRNNILSLLYEGRRHRLFKDFSQHVIGISESCMTRTKLETKVKEYDYIITGSDQVWHPKISEGQTCFFLDLPIERHKKIAYAASFGVADYNNEDVEKYMPLINDIYHLSVREEKGQNIIKKYLGRDAKLVVDPTMLLDKKEWNSIARQSKFKKYLFYFTILDEKPGSDDLVREIAKERGLSIVKIGNLKDILKIDFINARSNGPQEFLGLVRDADFVVTSSFHGTVFSILFEKEFLCILNNNERNSRLETLTGKLGLCQNLVSNPLEYNYSNNYHNIDYIKVNQLLNTLRNESLSFLRDAIN